MNKLRICIISPQFALVSGGAGIQAERHARKLQELGHEVTILTLRTQKDWPSEENYHGLPVIRIGGYYNRQGRLRIGRLGHFPIDILAFAKLWQICSQFDVFHVFEISTIGGVAALIGQLRHIPVILRIPSAGPSKEHQQIGPQLLADTLAEKPIDLSFLKIPSTESLAGDFKYLEKTAIGGKFIHHYMKKSPAYFHVLSTRCQNSLIEQGVHPDRIVKIANGVDIERFVPDPQVRPDPAQPLRAILCVARLEFAKGTDVLLHAWGRMMNAPAEWRAQLEPKLLLAGDGQLQSQMKRIAQELDITESVEFLGPQKNVLPLLQKSWAFILPSRWEGMPNALLESMSCGIASIATRVSGCEDIIQDGINGLLVNPENPEQMAIALQSLIADPSLTQRLAGEGYNTILRDYQLSRISEQCLDFYRQIIYKSYCGS